MATNSSDSFFPAPMLFATEAAGAALWGWRLSDRKAFFAGSWMALTGFHAENAPSSIDACHALAHPADKALALEPLFRIERGECESCEHTFRVVRRDGISIRVKNNAMILERDAQGMPLSIACVATLDKAEDTTDAAFWEWDFTNGQIHFSDEYLRMLGHTRESLAPTVESWNALCHPDDLEMLTASVNDYLSGKADSYGLQFRMLHRDGYYIDVFNQGWLTEWNEAGMPMRMVGKNRRVDGSFTPTPSKAASRGKQTLGVQDALDGRYETWQLNQAVFEANPYVCLLFDDQFRLIDCNPEAVRYFGFTAKDDLLTNFIAFIAECIPQTQPGGAKSISLAERLVYARLHGQINFETELILRGRKTPMHLIFKRLAYRDSFVIALYQMELSLLQYDKDKLYKQDRLLQAANTISSILMEVTEPDNLATAVQHAVALLAEGVDADRSYLWKNKEENGEILCTRVTAWSKKGPANQLSTDAPVSLATLMPEWEDHLKADQNVIRHVAPSEALRALVPGIGNEEFSVLTVPIFLHGIFWGYIGFDDHKPGRVYTDSEQDIIRSAALMIGSAFLRNEMLENLIESREAALESTRAKSTFLSHMSHEIRTPMNAIIGMNTIARKSKDFSKIQYCLDKIDTASQQLLGIINDVLDMSKIEANKLEITPRETDFERMMQKIFNMVQVKMDEKHQEFTIDLQHMFTHTVICDELRVTQVMINLLNNAIKFTPEYGRISVKVRFIAGERESSRLRVEVKDSGIGLTDEQKSRLFTPFQQADNSITRRFGGTGLGLSICKRIVNLMGGDIWVDSEPEQGSCFTFEIDIEWGGELKTEIKRSAPMKKLRILVVDDTDDVRVYFRNILKSFSLDCDTAEDGFAAVDLVKRSLEQGEPYDFVFLDWRMPGMSGAETAREILRLMDNNIIVVMISVADWSDIEEEVRDTGITRFLSKPVLPSALFNTILELADQTVFYSEPVTLRPPKRNWEGKHILIAEDIEINREIVMNFLGETDVSVDAAENGAIAVNMYLAAPEKYDVILMDVQMPELDGLDATRLIRTSGLPNAQVIPIVAMTSNAFKEDVQECLEAGMNNHVAKPIDVEDMMKKLSLYLE